MKVLVLNGSPKGEKSNTMCLTKAFLNGLAEKQPIQTEILPVCQMNLKPCIGCFACWSKTPGKCCLNDEMDGVIKKMIDADIIIWSFPLYYFGLPSQLKTLMDRQLPMNLPFMTGAVEGNVYSGAHPPRYDLSGKRYVVISTCGFYTSNGNYDAVNFQFDRVLGKDRYEKLYCGQGELFHVPELSKRTNEYLQFVNAAGIEFSQGNITAKTKTNLDALLYPREAFEQMANASWGIMDRDNADTKDASLAFTRQMAALYNKEAWSGKDKVLEMQYTDRNMAYQIVLQKEGHEVLMENFLPYTTKIETPFTVWQQIAKNELDGQTALMEHLYRIDGDFDLMMDWDNYFGIGKSDTIEETPSNTCQKTNMTLLLLPWILIWILLSINQRVGGILGISVCALIPFAYLKWKPTVFEFISTFTVTGISLLSLLSYSVAILVPISYFAFGLMWTVSVFLKIPLTAYYSMHGYGGEQALNNPLFIRTNRILTACWGVLYLITPVWTYFLMISSVPWITGAVNSILPFFLGIFNTWFQKWYPPYYAKKS